MATAKGRFAVKVEPLSPNDESEGVTFGRMSIDKTWQGDFEGTSTGEMLTAGTNVAGKMSAGYVAIERVRGTLAGRTGSFVFQHSATMDRGSQELIIRVVPDTGTGELKGIAGTLSIEIAGGEHSYTLDYSLQDAE